MPILNNEILVGLPVDAMRPAKTEEPMNQERAHPPFMSGGDVPGGISVAQRIEQTTTSGTWIPFQRTPRKNQAQRQAADVAAQRSFYNAHSKHALDIAVAALLLILLAIPMLIIAAVILCTSQGSPIFRQRRVGKDGQLFTMLKFRTMIAESISGYRLFTLSDGSVRHKIRDDPRVTPVGRILRRTSLDELPQLINVVRGEMSLIGPRPELPEIVCQYEPLQHRRHAVRPGMTGWWQTHGRGQGLMHERIDLDLYYVERVSFHLDVAIAFKTIRVLVTGNGAF